MGKNNTLGGFETILDGFIGRTEQEEQLDEIKDDIEPNEGKIEDPVVAKMKQDNVIKKEEDKDEPTQEDDDDDIKPDTKPTKPTKPVETPEVNDDDDSDDESTIVGNFFDAMAEKLNWSDVTEDERPKTIDQLLDYFSELIDEESKPQYASREVEMLDQYVRQGGNIQDYLRAGTSIDLDNINLEDENTQKIVVRQLLREKGFSDKQINKKIEKYIDAGLLEDEAEDAVEDLKEINQQKKEQLLAEQKRAYDKYIRQQQAFYDSVVDEIKNLNNIRGIAIPEKDKRVLIDYILKPDGDGMTKYQKDYRKGGVKSLIESAYFTMNADRLINSAKREGNNSAVEKFKNSLKNSSVSTKSRSVNNRKDDDTIWSSLTRHLRMS